MGMARTEPAEELRAHRRFEQISLLRKGAFGSVVLARDRLTGRRVALKAIPRSNQAAVEFAEQEVLLQQRLHHPHIVPLREVFLTDSYLVLVLDYVPGGDLEALMQPGQGLPESQARWIFQQILFALDYMHRLGVAWRDVKLENVLVEDASNPQSLVTLCDFGLACKSSGANQLRPVGTPQYMAPEIVYASMHGRLYDAKKADVWSCGVLLYLLLTGASPFQRPEDAELPDGDERIKAVLGRVLRLDYSLPNWLPLECRDLIARMLDPDAMRRPTIQEVMCHTWCRGGLQPESMLAANCNFVANTLATTPAPKVMRELYALLAEAQLGPAPASPRGVLGHCGSDSEEDSLTIAWPTRQALPDAA